jgi:hypothetical protein
MKPKEGHDMTTTITVDPDPCEATGCSLQTDRVEACRKSGCAYRWQREGREDRQRRDEHDRKAKENVCP